MYTLLLPGLKPTYYMYSNYSQHELALPHCSSLTLLVFVGGILAGLHNGSVYIYRCNVVKINPLSVNAVGGLGTL